MLKKITNTLIFIVFAPLGVIILLTGAVLGMLSDDDMSTWSK